jgi:hypothetical protein
MRILLNDRWRPYLIGCVASLPVIVVMLQVWKNWDYLAWAWLCLYAFLDGLDVFWKTYARKLVSTALAVGTLVPFLIR